MSKLLTMQLTVGQLDQRKKILLLTFLIFAGLC